MKRIQFDNIIDDLNKKMVFITGPRQVGKTWLAKEISKKFNKTLYLNFDDFDDRTIILERSWNKSTELLIFDELHKMDNWKTYIKGVFDNKKDFLKILVTGSARLHTFKKGGDSLAGRFFLHRLMPFCLTELQINNYNHGLEKLINRGGFPEPFLSKTDTEASRWRNLYVNGLIREDILDFSNISELKKMELLVELLRRRVGSPVSFKSIAEDLNLSPVTVSKYVDILESLFIIFKVSPFSKNISRSILKESKIYFFDNGMVIGDEGKKLENFVGVSLLKHCFLNEDLTGEKLNLNYIRTKDGKEVDFCISDNIKIKKIIEVKKSKTNFSENLFYFSRKYNLEAVQIVKNLDKEKQIENIELKDIENFLLNLKIL